MRALPQKLGCRVCHMFWCGLAGGFATIFAKLYPTLHDVEGRPCCVMNDVVDRWISKSCMRCFTSMNGMLLLMVIATNDEVVEARQLTSYLDTPALPNAGSTGQHT